MAVTTLLFLLSAFTAGPANHSAMGDVLAQTKNNSEVGGWVGEVLNSPSAAPTAECKIAPKNGQAAISAAIAKCPNGTAETQTVVRFPAGASYSVDGPIVVDRRSNLTIDANGSVFRNTAPKSDATNPTWKLRLGTNLTLRAAKVEGAFRPTNPDRFSGAGLRTSNQFNAGVAVFGGSSIRIEDVSAKNIWGDAVLVVHSDSVLPSDPGRGSQAADVHVTRLSATTHTRQCVGATSVRGFWVEDSTCRDSWYGGVDLEIDAGVSSNTITDAHVLRNTFDGYFFYAIAVPQTDGRADAVRGLEVRGNRVVSPPDTCRSPVMIKSQEDASGGTISDVTVADNEVKTLYNGIELTDVVSGAVTNNAVTITKSPDFCGPPRGVPIKLVRSPVALSGNTSTGY